MEEKLFDINNFNIIQDEENYYFFRALNMADNNDIEQGITMSANGKIERIRTDRERYEGETKYKENSTLSLEEMYDHIKMHYRKDTNCISLTSNANVAVNYGRGSYKDKYVMIQVPKRELGEKVVVAGQYMLRELSTRIENAVENTSKEQQVKIQEYFKKIESANENKELQGIIKQRYTAKSEDVNLRKAHLRKGIIYTAPKTTISSYQALNNEQLLELNKLYAKLAILEKEQILKNVIPYSMNSKLKKTIGNAFSSVELIHYGDIKQENILEIPKEVADIFALVQQVDGIETNKVEALKQAIVTAIKTERQFPEIAETKLHISIEKMYELTEGKIEYGKANTMISDIYYLSQARQNAIVLSNVISNLVGNDIEFKETIDHIRKNAFRIEPQIISRRSNKGIKLSEAVNLKTEEKVFVEEIKQLSYEELKNVIQSGGFDVVKKTFSDIKEAPQIDKSRYYAEAIISLYNWEKIGIEEFKIEERNELATRLQKRNCVEIYQNLKTAQIDEQQIPTILLNIVTRDGLYEQYAQGNLEQLLNTRHEFLQEDINIEVVERFLGYYDIKNTGIRLKDYQQRAFNNVNQIFEDNKFAQVILPTGAGKSFVALAQMQKYAEEHPNEKMLYLAPQDEIINQIKNYIVKYIHGKQETLGKTEDEIIAERFPNITFETYSGLLAKRGKELIKDQYGMIVLDELHRTGAKEWEGKIDKLFENQNENVKVLGITATPIRDADGRDMAEENARKLGYTDEQIKQMKHIASNMTLENAIRMGYVVNPKLVYCKYDLISSGKMDELKEKIEEIEDDALRAEELEKYNALCAKLKNEIDAEIGEEARRQLEEEARRNLDNGIGKEKILKENIKKGGKYIVFIPVTDQGDIEDENGNRIGTKTGEDKIKAYQEYFNKVFTGTDITPQLHSLLGSYSKEKNKKEIEAFETNNSETTKFMVVMNKANEGLHIDGVDGIIWFRALDENSRILYLQQLGRAIYALDEDNPLPDDKRPIVIDLVNNSLTVKTEKEFEKSEPIDDLEALTIVTEWIEQHNGILPNRNSTNNQEQHYYAVLRRIQSKYNKYLDGFENFEDLTEENISRIQNIMHKATSIELWDMELPPLPKRQGNKEINHFEITGVLRDYVCLANETDTIEKKNIYEKVIEFLETHNGQLMKGNFTEKGETLIVEKLTKAQRYEKNLYQSWIKSKERRILEEHNGKAIETVPEEYREKIAKLRELIRKEKTTYEKVIEHLETHNGKLMQSKFKKDGKQLTKEQKEEKNLYTSWNRSEERKILVKYEGKEIEEVPEEYRVKIARLRELIRKEKTTYEKVIEHLETHNGELMKNQFKEGDKKINAAEMTEEQRKEVQLYDSWIRSEERKVLEEYAGNSIEEVPEEYREKITKLREFGLGKKEKTPYEETIDFLETHDGELMQGNFEGLTVDLMSKEQQYEYRLYQRWRNAKERKVLEEYEEKPIEEVPEEYREKIAKLREFGLGKTPYEETIEFLETHDGELMQSEFAINGNRLKREEMTKEQRDEVRLYARWKKSEERKVLEEYAGKSIEEVPEEYREKITKLREFGLGKKEKTPYEETIDFLEMHNGILMKSSNKEERKLYKKWKRTKECKVLKEYTGQPIEKVPEEYRDKIAKLREFGLGTEKSKLSKAKQKRDDAKDKNKQANELEQKTFEQLKKRGVTYGEQ